jgi:imidazolonepropionase-like amidohydrolase
MRKLGISFVLWLAAVVSAVQTPAQSAVPVTLIKAGRLLDPCTGNVLAPAALLLEGDKIKQVGSASHDDGMPPLEILHAVTTNAAEMLGWQDVLE